MIARGVQGTRVPHWAGQGVPDGVALRVHGRVFPVSARDSSGPWGVSDTPYEGAAEGGQDLVHKGRMHRLASVSLRIAGCSCPPIASAQIWWIAKTGHRLVAVGVSAVRLC